jgi:shikimate kinase
MGSPRQRNLILIGYRGSGKTTVGRQAAQRLGYAFVDTDERVVAEAGQSIAAIFEQEGEAGFREREARAIQEATRGSRRVISAGGGAILRSDNVTRLRERGFVVWLTASPDVLWRRIERDEATSETRPALSRLAGVEEVRTVLASRLEAYRRAADGVVDASGDDIERIVLSVLNLYASDSGGSSAR